MKKLSIIIPCYNVSKYINKCIDSVLNSSLKDIEIIVINDGSKDNTLELLKQYKDDRIVLINRKTASGGASVPRNEGLKIATGEYITFLDSDDYVEPDMYLKMYNKAKKNKLDMVACDVLMEYPDHTVTIKSNVNDNSINKELMIDAYAVVWNKIYKKEILKDLVFTKDMRLCEDVEFLYKIYSRVNKIGSIDEALYHYLQRENSLTYVYDEKIYHVIQVMDNILEYYKSNNLYELYKDELEYSYVRYCYGTFIKRLAKTKDKKKFKEGIKFAKEKVRKNFPNYKKNKYINTKNKKNSYFKHFNYLLGIMVYYKEKNRLN